MFGSATGLVANDFETHENQQKHENWVTLFKLRSQMNIIWKNTYFHTFTGEFAISPAKKFEIKGGTLSVLVDFHEFQTSEIQKRENKLFSERKNQTRIHPSCRNVLIKNCEINWSFPHTCIKCQFDEFTFSRAVSLYFCLTLLSYPISFDALFLKMNDSSNRVKIALKPNPNRFCTSNVFKSPPIFDHIARWNALAKYTRISLFVCTMINQQNMKWTYQQRGGGVHWMFTYRNLNAPTLWITQNMRILA